MHDALPNFSMQFLTGKMRNKGGHVTLVILFSVVKHYLIIQLGAITINLKVSILGKYDAV